jgi:hypothetical protein
MEDVRFAEEIAHFARNNMRQNRTIFWPMDYEVDYGDPEDGLSASALASLAS